MINPKHLIEQAEELARLDAGRPRGVNLRRAVSSAYYAVFHHRVRAAVRRGVGGTPSARGPAGILARGYGHEAFRGISQQFGGGVGCWPAWMRDAVAGTDFDIPPELRESCRLFVQLQDRRHAADYDPGWRSDRTRVLATVSEAKRSIVQFDGARGTSARRFYLAAAPLWETLRKRRVT